MFSKSAFAITEVINYDKWWLVEMFCSKCGAQIEDTAVFCSKCGNKQINVDTAINDVMVKQCKNPITKFIFITIALQIILVILSARPGMLGGIAFGTALSLVAIVFALSIVTIVKSKKYYNKGKAVGIIFTVLSSILIAVVVLAVVAFKMDNSVDTNENQYINQCINAAAINSIGTLKDSLKDPSSLKINKIYAKVYDTRITAQFSDGTYYNSGDFKGYFEIYIDYTANNGLGGVNRGYYRFKYNQDLIRINVNEINSMLIVANDVWVLDTEEYNNLAENMIIH